MGKKTYASNNESTIIMNALNLKKIISSNPSSLLFTMKKKNIEKIKVMFAFRVVFFMILLCEKYKSIKKVIYYTIQIQFAACSNEKIRCRFKTNWSGLIKR